MTRSRAGWPSFRPTGSEDAAGRHVKESSLGCTDRVWYGGTVVQWTYMIESLFYDIIQVKLQSALTQSNVRLPMPPFPSILSMYVQGLAVLGLYLWTTNQPQLNSLSLAALVTCHFLNFSPSECFTLAMALMEHFLNCYLCQLHLTHLVHFPMLFFVFSLNLITFKMLLLTLLFLYISWSSQR